MTAAGAEVTGLVHRNLVKRTVTLNPGTYHLYASITFGILPETDMRDMDCTEAPVFRNLEAETK